jgi:mRNA interferase MazF
MVITQYGVYLVNLDPTVGHEIKKTRPCVVISPDEMNEFIATVIVAPLTSKSKPYPTRIPFRLLKRDGWIVLDQIRTIDKVRAVKRMGGLDPATVTSVKKIIKEMLVD